MMQIFSTILFLVVLTSFAVPGHGFLTNNHANRLPQLRSFTSIFSSKPETTITTKVPRIEIEYCPGCKWMLRSTWYAQELLTTFEGKIGEIALIPSATTGTFIVRINNEQIWDRRDEKTKGFPEIKELKQLVRDVIAPDQGLGHSDKKA